MSTNAEYIGEIVNSMETVEAMTSVGFVKKCSIIRVVKESIIRADMMRIPTSPRLAIETRLKMYAMPRRNRTPTNRSILCPFGILFPSKFV
jgi:hypothetical protein